VLKDHNFGNQTVNLQITINDSFLPENNGTLVIHFKAGKGIVVEDDKYDVEIIINVDHFSSLIMGAISFKKLYEYGLVKISNADYLGTLNKLFVTETPPMTMESF